MSGSEALQADIDSILMPPPPKRFCNGMEHGNLSRASGVEFSILPPPPSNPEQHSSLETATATGQDDFSGMMQQAETVGASSLPDTINFVTPPKAAAAETCASPAEAHDGNDTNFSETDSMQSESSTVIAESLSSDNQEQRHVMPETTTTRFSDIIGHASVKLRIDEMLLPLALPPALADSILTGVRSLPACLLLYGPPGCGKVRLVADDCVVFDIVCVATCSSQGVMMTGTHTNSMQTQLARAIAGEARAAFISVGPSDILSKFVGESEASVRSIFQKGKRLQTRQWFVLCQHTRH